MSRQTYRFGERQTLRADGFPEACVGWPCSGLTAAPPAGRSGDDPDPWNDLGIPPDPPPRPAGPSEATGSGPAPPACAGGLSVPRAEMEALRAPQMAMLERLSARYPALHVWDPMPLLCTPQRCAAMDGDQPLFFDQDHLSGHGNRTLLPDFDRLLLEIGERTAAMAAPPAAGVPQGTP